MAKEGIPYIILFLVPAVPFVVLGGGSLHLCAWLAASMAFFFRDPKRECPGDERVIFPRRTAVWSWLRRWIPR